MRAVLHKIFGFLLILLLPFAVSDQLSAQKTGEQYGTPSNQQITTEKFDQILQNIEDMQNRISKPDVVNPQAESAAKQAFDVFNSDGYQKRIKTETDRIKKHFDPVMTSPAPKEDEKAAPEKLKQDERIYIFVSSSMPDQTLRAYIQGIDKLKDPNIVMVLRGFVDGLDYFKPTLKFLEKILVKEENCRISEGKKCTAYKAKIEVDPQMFTKLNITRVPAIAYIRNIKISDNARSVADNLTGDIDATIVYGSVTLDFALEKLFETTKVNYLKQAVKKIRGNFYEG